LISQDEGLDIEQELEHVYHPRVIDGTLQRALNAAGAVVIEGARVSGKTMTAMNTAASYVLVDDPFARQLIDLSPRVLLEGPSPSPAG
jgi:hypothetical protein